MAVIDLGKIKLSYRGSWIYGQKYSSGDIVTLGSQEINYFDESVNYQPTVTDDGENNPALFIFKGDTPTNSYPYIPTQVVAAKNGIATTGISTNVVSDVRVYLGYTGDSRFLSVESAVVPGCSYFHHENFPSNTKIVGITTVLQSTIGSGLYATYTLELNKYSIGTGTTECVPAVIGTRRVGNRYETSLNTEDWDIYSQGMTYSGEFDKYKAYVPGDIVTKTHDDGQVSTYICVTPIGPGSSRPRQDGNSTIVDGQPAAAECDHAATNNSAVVYRPHNSIEQGVVLGSWDQYQQDTMSNIRLGTTSNLGGSYFALTPDPEFDTLGVWQSFMSGDVEPHQKATLLPNNQPVDWQGHPYIKQAAWSNILPSRYYWNGLNTNNNYGPFGSLGGTSNNSPYSSQFGVNNFSSSHQKLRYQWFDEGTRAVHFDSGSIRTFTREPYSTTDVDPGPYSVAYTTSSSTVGYDALAATLGINNTWYGATAQFDGYCRSDGKRAWILTNDWTDGNGDTWNFLQFDLTTAFDFTTATSPVFAYVPGPGMYNDGGSTARNHPRSFTFSPNGRHLYVVGRKDANVTRTGYVATDGDIGAMAFIAKIDLRGKSFTFGHPDDLNPSTSGAWNVEGDYTNSYYGSFEGNLKFASDATADEFRIDNIQFSTDGLTLYALGSSSEPTSGTHAGGGNRLQAKDKLLAWNLAEPYNIKKILEKEVINSGSLITDTMSYAGSMWVGSSGGSQYKKTMERFVLLSERSSSQYEIIWGGYGYGSDTARDPADLSEMMTPMPYLDDENNEWLFSRIAQKYQGGKPWHLPVDIRYKNHHWRWNTSKQKRTDSAFCKIHFVDGDGNTKSLGGSYSYDNDRIQAGGTTYPSGYTAESTAPIDVEFLSDETPGYGNSLFDDSLEPRTKIIQYIRLHHGVWTLQNNGIVSFAGYLGDGTHSTFPFGTDASIPSFNGRYEIPRDVFKGRSIVKISASSNSPRNSISYEGAVYVLDEAGELWSWGSARLGLLGIGSENITPSQQNYAGITTTGDNGGYGVPDNVDDRQSNAPWCLGKEAFGGRKIVDFEVSSDFFVIAMDDHGDIWTWGNGGDGALGYSTQEGFVSDNCARRPQLITSPLGYSFQGEGLDASTAVRTQYLTGSTGSTYDMEILAGGTKVKRRDGTSYNHNAAVSTNVGYAQTVAVSASFDTVDQYQYFGLDNGVATGNVSGNTDHIDYMWYGYGGNGATYGYLYIWLDGSAQAKVGVYNQNSVMSIVYDPNDGFVNFYFDKDGDGISNRLVYRRKKDVVSGSYDALLYPSFGMYGASAGDGLNTSASGILQYGEPARGISNIQITDKIVRKTWKDYGGIQKFVVKGGGSWGSSATTGPGFTILDGQGYIWNTSGNSAGQRGSAGDGDLWELDVSGYNRGSGANTSPINEGDTFTAIARSSDNIYYSLSRKKLPFRYSAKTSVKNPYSTTSIASGLQGRINNVWVTGTTDHGTLLSVTGVGTHLGGIGETHSETWYMGANTNYQATTSTNVDQFLPVQVKATGIAGANRNAINHNVGTNSVDHNLYLQDIVMASSGGGLHAAGSSNISVTFAMDKHGYLYSFGYNSEGQSGTSVAHEASVSLDSNNITYQHEAIDNSWPRVYTPNHLQGKCIDVVVFGENYYTTYVDYNDAGVSLFQFDDASLLWCGHNNPWSPSYAYMENHGHTKVSIMKTLSGFQ